MLYVYASLCPVCHLYAALLKVRVWMREQSLETAAVAEVTDKLDGDYEAEFTALWVGRPEIRVAVIEPREVMAIRFRRR